MEKLPFYSNVFISKWLARFNNNLPYFRFNSIEGPMFIKKKWIPLYINIGKTLTKGLSYKLYNGKDCKKKVFLIYDVPNNSFSNKIEHQYLKLKTVNQYKGFLLNLSSYENLQDYLSKNFSKSGRYKLKKYLKRFNLCYKTTYKMYYGSINKKDFLKIFSSFKVLQEKRFFEKKIINNNLNIVEWEFYKDIAYPMILNKEAALFVVYEGNKPVSITLNYVHEKKIINAITVFDIDYSKFNLGYINFMKLIEWCIANKFKTLDFSKGYFDYKKRWSNHQYLFKHHILYDKNHLKSKLIALGLIHFFKLKQKLREKHFNTYAQKLKFLFKKNTLKKNVPEYRTAIIKNLPNTNKIIPVKKEYVIEQPMIKKHIYNFQYINTIQIKQIKFYENLNIPKSFYLEGNGKVLNIFIKQRNE